MNRDKPRAHAIGKPALSLNLLGSITRSTEERSIPHRTIGDTQRMLERGELCPDARSRNTAQLKVRLDRDRRIGRANYTRSSFRKSSASKSYK